jgi:hypothetical protein
MMNLVKLNCKKMLSFYPICSRLALPVSSAVQFRDTLVGFSSRQSSKLMMRMRIQLIVVVQKLLAADYFDHPAPLWLWATEQMDVSYVVEIHTRDLNLNEMLQRMELQLKPNDTEQPWMFVTMQSSEQLTTEQILRKQLCNHLAGLS